MYRVKKAFTDKEDGFHLYKADKEYPRKDRRVLPSVKRIEELVKHGRIEKIEDKKKEVKKEKANVRR